MESGEPRVVVAPSGSYGSGLSVAYAERFLGDSRNLVCVTCYQSPCSVGHQLQRAKPGGQIEMADKTHRVNAQVRTFRLSAHASGSDLLEMIDRLKPAKGTYLVHGEAGAMKEMERQIPGSIAPHIGEQYGH